MLSVAIALLEAEGEHDPIKRARNAYERAIRSTNDEVIKRAAETTCLNVLAGRPSVLKSFVRAGLGINGMTRESVLSGFSYHTLQNYVRNIISGVGEDALLVSALITLDLYRRAVVVPILQFNTDNYFAPRCVCGKSFHSAQRAMSHILRAHKGVVKRCVDSVVDVYNKERHILYRSKNL